MKTLRRFGAWCAAVFAAGILAVSLVGCPGLQVDLCAEHKGTKG